MLQDMESSNGTFLYIRKPLRLHPGETVRVRMGRKTLKLTSNAERNNFQSNSSGNDGGEGSGSEGSSDGGGIDEASFFLRPRSPSCERSERCCAIGFGKEPKPLADPATVLSQEQPEALRPAPQCPLAEARGASRREKIEPWR